MGVGAAIGRPLSSGHICSRRAPIGRPYRKGCDLHRTKGIPFRHGCRGGHWPPVVFRPHLQPAGAPAERVATAKFSHIRQIPGCKSSRGSLLRFNKGRHQGV